ALVLLAIVVLGVGYRVIGVYRFSAGECVARPARRFASTYPRHLIVMTYNIEGHASLFKPHHIEEIAATINRQHPDIVGLNEVPRRQHAAVRRQSESAVAQSDGATPRLHPSRSRMACALVARRRRGTIRPPARDRGADASMKNHGKHIKHIEHVAGTTYVRLPIIAFIGGLLALIVLTIAFWSAKRKQDAKLNVKSASEIRTLLPSLVGLTQSTLDGGNSVQVLQNGNGFFPPMLRD